MKRILLLFILVIEINSVFGQTTNEKNNFLNLNLISPIYSYSPRWNLGYHRVLNRHFILGAEVGFGSYGVSINNAADADWIEDEYFSFEFSPELKYMINPADKTKMFASVDLFYIYHSDNLKDRTYEDQTDMNFYRYESADYQRHKFGLNLNYGFIINFSDTFGLIPKIGLGVKMRDVNFSNIKNPVVDNNYEESDTFFPTSNDFLTVEGFHTNVNFNFELQFYFKY